MNGSKPRRRTGIGRPDQAHGTRAADRGREAASDPESSSARERAGVPDADARTLSRAGADATGGRNLSVQVAGSGARAFDTSSPPNPLNAPQGKRAAKSQARREAILAAALDEFTERGFAATRIDDVARRAGVGKGTIYLHFQDKEALFQQLVIAMLGPIVAQLQGLPDEDKPVRAVLERLLALFAKEVYGTKRREVLRLVMAEGPRFPQLAEFYYRHVVEPAIAALRGLLERARARGELRLDRIIEYPQLVIAPGLIAIIWSGLFDRFAPLDMPGLMRAHLELLLGPGDGP
jgi:AcrR family transcriptional regulator